MLDSTVVCRRALGCEWGGLKHTDGEKIDTGPRVPTARRKNAQARSRAARQAGHGRSTGESFSGQYEGATSSTDVRKG